MLIFRICFRTRTASGVTSTSSSASIHSIAVSIVSVRGEASITFSSLPWLRTFVSFFSLMTFTSVSFGRLCSPTIIPS